MLGPHVTVSSLRNIVTRTHKNKKRKQKLCLRQKQVLGFTFNLFEIVQQDSHTEGREGNSVFLDGGTISIFFSHKLGNIKRRVEVYHVPLVVHHVI